MATLEPQTQHAIREIVRILGQFTQDQQSESNGQVGSAAGCRIMPLPQRLWGKGAEVAARINPVNAPLQEPQGSYPSIDEPMRLTLTTSKYWGPRPKKLSVSFMETTPAELRARIISHLNAWSQSAGISFHGTSGTGDVRISRGPGGYYSYLGTDIKLIPTNRQTMNLQGFTMNTSESEYRRVIRHEAGHTLGFPHEHMRKALVDRIDPAKAYAYFLRTQGWDKTTVDQQVLTPLGGNSIIGTEPDQDSIMCYQLPGEITYDGQPIRGGLDINATDYLFAGTIYPKVLHASAESMEDSSSGSIEGGANDWDPVEDVKDISYE
ncbi:astacin (peptidase family M12A) [Arthrobacter sp. SLBN-100]|uniref:M12 family metallopeptidase n=1 Tax=Arthrobacter sp. SLBN-100 TaxID=2768450 RepID=UPI00114D87C0|nr:M12 family metallopeptidase [Arthrobacter sp. SLBN-100]TQJ69672.1 astacin (peptidase family M12A) [Arthrobacter sp. SLBN-100]